MRNPNYFSRSLGAIGLGLAVLCSAPAAAQYESLSQLKPKKPNQGREEGETITLNLETGTFSPSLPFDVGFKLTGPTPPGFGPGSRIDARFVEFNGPPECAGFFSQYTLAKGGLPDLNVTDAIPLRRRRRSTALETSGFRQATVFDAGGVNLQAGRGFSGAARNLFGQNLGRLGGQEAEEGAAAGAEETDAGQVTTFLVDFPPLRPNHYYCFQFIARRALSKEDLERLRTEFRKVIDAELQEEKWQEDRLVGIEKKKRFVVSVEDYEDLRVALSAAIESALETPNQVVLAPANSFFNVGATLETITAKYREEFSDIAKTTVDSRFDAIDDFNEAVTSAVAEFSLVAEKKVKTTQDQNPRDLLAVLRAAGSDPAFKQELERIQGETTVNPVELLGFSKERLERRFRGIQDDQTEAIGLADVWVFEVGKGPIRDRVEDLKELSQAIAGLTRLAELAGVDPISQLKGESSQAEAVDSSTQEQINQGFQPPPPPPTRQPSSPTPSPPPPTPQPSSPTPSPPAETTDLILQTADLLGHQATEQLLQLRRTLELRNKQIFAWVEQILVEEQASLVVGATTVADYDTRAGWYMSADIGSGISELEDFFTYVGWNIYLRPVNKKAHLSWSNRPFSLGEEFMRRFSFTLGVVQTGFDEKEGELAGVIGSSAAVLGAGLRVNDSLRLSAGGLIFEGLNPNPLIDDTELQWSPYLAISLDWNIGGALSGLVP